MAGEVGGEFQPVGRLTAQLGQDAVFNDSLAQLHQDILAAGLHKREANTKYLAWIGTET